MGDDWVVRANTRKWRRGREGSMSLWEEKEGGKREERGEREEGGKRGERGGRKEEGGKRKEEGRALPIVQGVRIEEREIR